MAKTILITGASSGLGAGMAHEFAAKGYNLAICARRLDRLETLKTELETEYGIKVLAKAWMSRITIRSLKYFAPLNKNLAT